MTVINGIEIDVADVPRNPAVDAIQNNERIEKKLHVIVVLSNPCQFARRFRLAREFLLRMARERDIIVYVVELAYGDQKFYVTSTTNPKHLQLRTTTPLWHKENMINIGIRKLLPTNWKACAWIDADIEFDNHTWATDTLRILNGSSDIVQLWSHACDMDHNGSSMRVFESVGYLHSRNEHHNPDKVWHPGFAWAMTRRAYEKCGGLYDVSILGSGDHNMSMAIRGYGRDSLNVDMTEAYKHSIEEWQSKIAGVRLGYVPGVIRHHFHGSKFNRHYHDRWEMLRNHHFDPYTHLSRNKDGLLVPTESCPPELLNDIMRYFAQRNEDELYNKSKK